MLLIPLLDPADVGGRHCPLHPERLIANQETEGNRAVRLWRGGGEYSYIRVLPDEFILKSVVIRIDFKRNSSGRTQIYEYEPPSPINALVTALEANRLAATC